MHGMIPKDLLEILVCPACKQALEYRQNPESLKCDQCHRKYPTHPTLFDTLYEFSRTSPENCPACGSARELRVSVDFQLGGGDGEFKVVSAFLPDKLESWLGEDEQEVTLYPFVVVLQNGE